MRFQSYFNTAVQLLKASDGSQPFAQYLKNYFAQHKKHGSKDRKYISHACYCYFRLGHSLRELATEERLRATIFLCNDSIAEWAVVFNEEWLAGHNVLPGVRANFLQQKFGFDFTQIFPWHSELSEGVDAEAFAKSHIIQPDLFLRIRPGKRAAVMAKLNASGLPYKELSENCLALANNSQVDKIVNIDSETVVQDYSSQQIGSFFSIIQSATGNPQSPIDVWDCCAASGGKSILAYDTFKSINLTVSDIRPSIINNLKQRFAEAGIKNYKSFVTDLSVQLSQTAPHSPLTIHHSRFDVIICDAPCSGSGTWGRTPEQLYYFTPDKIEYYSALQQKILATALKQVKPGGYFLYITCSVFAKENERVAENIAQQGAVLVKKQLIAGYGLRADTMFAALYRVPD